MEPKPIRFNDASAYERYMGKWSQLAGEAFLDWLAPGPGLRWLDVGCGSGAFTEMIVSRCAPKSIDGIDPSEEQVAFARTRPGLQHGTFRKGDAMALPYADDAFDAAVMPLVIFFVPDPAKGVAEMARVVAPGGLVSAYSWDMPGGGFPYAALREGMRAVGINPAIEASSDASRIDVKRQLWTGAGLTGIETREITVQRTFTDFDDYWQTILGGPSIRARFDTLDASQIETIKSLMRTRLPADAQGRITYSARANAIKGFVK